MIARLVLINCAMYSFFIHKIKFVHRISFIRKKKGKKQTPSVTSESLKVNISKDRENKYFCFY